VHTNGGVSVERSPVSAYELLYREVPHWEGILAAVKAGAAEFAATLHELRLLNIGLSTSSVHPYDDIELHAFILGLVSEDRWSEIQAKAFLTYASHWIDDFFDSPGRVFDPVQLLNDRHDIKIALENMGPVGEIGFAMMSRARHPTAIHKTLHRMLYGGLVQRSRSRLERHALVTEYRAIATRHVNPELVHEVETLQAEAYWTTNKSVLEISNAAEPALDLDTAELWNLVYAPALYYSDAQEERARGELSFEADEEPKLPEMVRMVQLGARQLKPRFGPNSAQMRQLEFVARSFRNLPAEILYQYTTLSGRYAHP
jgi:hypothetical protein